MWQKTSNGKKNYKHSIYLIRHVIWKYAKPYKSSIFITMAFMIIVAFSSSMLIKLSQPMIEHFFATKLYYIKGIFYIPFVALFFYSLKGIAEFFQKYITEYIGQKILADIQMNMYQNLLKSDFIFIQRNSSGKLLSYFTNDIMLIRAMVSNIFVSWARYFMSVTFLFFVMITLNFRLAALVFIFFPVSIYFSTKIGHKLRIVSSKVQHSLGEYTKKLSEVFSNIKLVKLTSKEESEFLYIRNFVDNILLLYQRAAKLDALTSPVMEIITGIAVTLILLYGSVMVDQDLISPAELIAFNTAFLSVHRPFKNLLSLNVHLQEAMASIERIFFILNYVSLKRKNVKTLHKLVIKVPDINFYNVSLSINNRKIISNLSLKMYGNGIYSIVGSSGSGKSSLVNLLLRLYAPDAGSIKVSGYHIYDLSLQDLRSQIYFVSQEVSLMNDTIFKNIVYGVKNVEYENLLKVTHNIGFDDFINSLSDGYDTIVGADGYNLSGGQKQLIAIARAILMDPSVLVLDEATSALDLKSENLVLDYISNLRRNKTTIIISHRLISIRKFADYIFVMKDGTCIEEGVHEDLILKKGEYFKLYEYHNH